MRRLALALLGWSVLAASVAPGTGPGRKLALIITIGAYPGASGYAPINTRYDADLVRTALLAQRFDSGDIQLLRDSAATKAGILAAFADLTDRAGPGDIVVVHYSGHGHRISDDNGEEIDGYDELLVPYGAPARVRAATYHGEQHLRDDEIGPLLERLRRRVGPTGSIAVFLDACYSGSATRAVADEPAVRGMLEPIEVAGSRKARSRPGSRGDDRALLDAPAGTVGPAGPLVVISAASFDQLAHETYDDAHRVVGSLSLAMSRTLVRLPPGATWRLLAERLGAAMAAMSLGDQQPQVEGDLDTPVLGGGLVVQHPYLRVNAVRGDSLVVLPGGAALGLLPGTRVALFPSGTTDPGSATPLASAVVREAGPDQAIAAIAGGGGARVRGSWAFVTEYAWAAEPLRLAIDRAVPAADAAALQQALAGHPTVQLVPAQADLRVVRARAPEQGVVLVAEPGRTRVSGVLRPDAPDFAGRVAGAITDIARVRMFRRLELSDTSVSVRLELIRAEARIDWSSASPQCRGGTPVLRPTDAGALRLKPREEYVLRFSHGGSEPAYLTVLDLTPDGRVEQVYPLPDAQGNDNRLEPGKSFTVTEVCFFAESVPGVEVLKLFASRRRLDFSSALGGTRGTPTVPGLGVNTDAVSFTVTPAP